MTKDSASFHEYPPLLVEDVRAWDPGYEREMVLLVYVDTGGDPAGSIFPVSWRHRELAFLAPGEKNAVAQGEVRFDPAEDYKPARILFSQYHKTAALRGTHLDGSIKSAPLR